MNVPATGALYALGTGLAVFTGSIEPCMAIVGVLTKLVSVSLVLEWFSGARLGSARMMPLLDRLLGLFDPSAVEKMADDYDEFGADDFCSLTNRIPRCRFPAGAARACEACVRYEQSSAPF